jgi:hypothetical protein
MSMKNYLAYFLLKFIKTFTPKFNLELINRTDWRYEI